jgi:hypothetical protein
MRRLDELHLDYPFAGSRMLRMEAASSTYCKLASLAQAEAERHQKCVRAKIASRLTGHETEVNGIWVAPALFKPEEEASIISETFDERSAFGYRTAASA